MINRVFAVYDSKALAFLQPFFSETVGSAVRAFGDIANEPKSPIGAHPGDYQLYELGSFDSESGKLIEVSPMRLLGCALDFVVQKPSAADMVRQMVERPLATASEISNGGN